MPTAPSTLQISYVALLFALFVVPRLFQRTRIPLAITSFALGAACGLWLDLFRGDTTIELLATFGIVSLFLFAGLDVDLDEMRGQTGILGQHILITLLGVLAVALIAAPALSLGNRAALLVSLALLTPSTGFILDSLERLNVGDRARYWIRAKAIAAELVALAVLFTTLQSTSMAGLGRSMLVLIVLIALLPWVFRLFAQVVVPHAPKSEFAFLMMVAVACGVITYQMGVYYLVGAFVVGMSAQRLRRQVPAMASEAMLSAVESFASLFVPFYFFNAGLQLRPEDLGLDALLLGGAFFALGVPLRVLLVWGHRRLALRESLRESLQVSMPMLPTLVFTLVLAQILRDRFDVSAAVFGGLVYYAALNSLVPGLVFGARLPEVEDELTEEHPLRSRE